MLSDEEKKAIKKVKYICDKWYDENLEIDVKWLESLLSLCEKQQKEIEKLKKQDLSNSKIIANMSTRHFNDREKIRKYEALQDKIKAKIEEWSKPKKFKEIDEDGEIVEGEIIYEDIVEALQSLLKEE